MISTKLAAIAIVRIPFRNHTQGPGSGYVINIEKATMQNDNFRKVLNTAEHSRLVVMSLLPGEEIGTEIYDLDQFIRFESGRGQAIMDDKAHDIVSTIC
ncbi:hypothetical protein D3OALGA1CA_254 [Olavius algarvensis associated proteobacterium Delta 3]|nr:hypothetical protein D3OALGA1CA_254 [Olavius algarvensis associated proteobacterium Delta 3]CAB5098639.1 hypothetical protein D3OALGB2SA_1690 [Olavius algarvensis associated proteobacterium Delta 3]